MGVVAGLGETWAAGGAGGATGLGGRVTTGAGDGAGAGGGGATAAGVGGFGVATGAVAGRLRARFNGKWIRTVSFGSPAPVSAEEPAGFADGAEGGVAAFFSPGEGGGGGGGGAGVAILKHVEANGLPWRMSNGNLFGICPGANPLHHIATRLWNLFRNLPDAGTLKAGTLKES